jgi:hypothetical protein
MDMIPDPMIVNFENLIERKAKPDERDRLYELKDSVDVDTLLWILAIAKEHIAIKSCNNDFQKQLESVVIKNTDEFTKATCLLFEKMSKASTDQFVLEREKNEAILRTFCSKLTDQMIHKIVGWIDDEFTRLPHLIEIAQSKHVVATSWLAQSVFLTIFGLATTALSAVVLAAFPQILFGLRNLLNLGG